jgi:hypothetical protein
MGKSAQEQLAERQLKELQSRDKAQAQRAREEKEREQSEGGGQSLPWRRQRLVRLKYEQLQAKLLAAFFFTSTMLRFWKYE